LCIFAPRAFVSRDALSSYQARNKRSRASLAFAVLASVFSGRTYRIKMRNRDCAQKRNHSSVLILAGDLVVPLPIVRPNHVRFAICA
jgi:hypothetical protein